jgi:hypothetical protein
MLRKILGPKKNKATGGWTKLHNRQLRDLYSSSNQEARDEQVMRQVWKRERGAYRVLVGNLSERDQVENPGTDRKIIQN